MSAILEFAYLRSWDSISNQTERAYTGWPDRLYLIGLDGRVIFKIEQVFPKPGDEDKCGRVGDAFAFIDGPDNVIGAQNVTSYAFCSAYSTAGWRGWHYLFPNDGGYFRPTKVTSIHQNEAEDWCYMT